MCKPCEQGNIVSAIRLRRRKLLVSCSATVGSFKLISAAVAEDIKSLPKPQNVASPAGALALLQEGNRRYVEGGSRLHDFRNEREALVSGQNPYAGVLSCADSRIAPEYAFDSSRGDLFVCRVAGNFAAAESIASFEYAVTKLRIPLIFVLGHDSCGAVSATIESLKTNTTLPGHLPSLVAALAAPTKAGIEQPGDALGKAIRQNVIDTVATLKSSAPILEVAVAQEKLKIVGGVYRLATGQVELVT